MRSLLARYVGFARHVALLLMCAAASGYGGGEARGQGASAERTALQADAEGPLTNASTIKRVREQLSQ